MTFHLMGQHRVHLRVGYGTAQYDRANADLQQQRGIDAAKRVAVR